MIESSNHQLTKKQPLGVRVLVVEDESELLELMGTFLSSEGYQVILRPDGSELMWHIETHTPDVVLLDQMLPGKQGSELLSEIRGDQRFAKLPVMMVTALSREQEVVSSLKLGADDYLTKPFSFLELVARVGALVRRSKVEERIRPEKFKHGPIEIDFSSRILTIADKARVVLTVTEGKILRLLTEEVGKVISREELCDRILNDEGSSPRTIDVHIASIRKKLGEHKVYLQTVRSSGFCFQPNV